MLLNFNFHENLINSEETESSNADYSMGTTRSYGNSQTNFHLISEKITIPNVSGHLKRKRLTKLLLTFSNRFGATLINGRAGTGKTTIASALTSKFQKVAWYSIGSTDSEWEIFSRYFISSLLKSFPDLNEDDFGELINDSNKVNVQKFVESLFIKLEKYCFKKSLLFVFDDLHQIFDADWFETFFKEILAHNFPYISILFLSRTQPPFPIWRLRSKQKLGYIDEKLLLFNSNELDEIIKLNKLDEKIGRKIHNSSFGRISKVLEIAGIDNSYEDICHPDFSH